MNQEDRPDNPRQDLTANAIIREARSWIGTPYLHQASLKGVGCDCLGLVRGVWRAVIGKEPQDVPGYTSDWGETAAAETLLEAARNHFTIVEEALPGDLLVFRWQSGLIAKHAGILIEPDRFIHAWEQAGVVESSLVPAWRRRIAGCFRYPVQNPVSRN